MTGRVVVGVVSGRHQVPRPWGVLPVQGVTDPFPALLAGAGAIPVALPVLEQGVLPAYVLLEAVDALLLAGGGDVDPQLYGAPPDPVCRGVDWLRDDAEVALARAATRAGIPVLGVCRGMQVLAVAFGGDLHRDIGSDHVIPGGTHRIRTAPGSLTRRLVGERAQVSSLHHQAVAGLGHRLEATAWSDDGVIEAIELPGADGPAALGVQWHPELEPGTVQRALFGWLVDTARAGSGVRSARP